LVSIIWAIGWGIVVLPGAAKKVALARISDAELISQLDECKLPPGVPPPPKGFYLDDCWKRLNQDWLSVGVEARVTLSSRFESLEHWLRSWHFFVHSACLPFVVRSHNWMGLGRFYKPSCRSALTMSHWLKINKVANERSKMPQEGGPPHRPAVTAQQVVIDSYRFPLWPQPFRSLVANNSNRVATSFFGLIKGGHCVDKHVLRCDIGRRRKSFSV
jgi:hypothetical protein